MNKVILIGEIVSEIVKKNEKAPAEIRILTKSEWRGESSDSKNNDAYHTVVVWGDKGIFYHKALRKGDIISVEGMLVYSKRDVMISDCNGNPVIIDNKPLTYKITETEIKAFSISKIN